MRLPIFILSVLLSFPAFAETDAVMPQKIRYPIAVGTNYPRNGRDLNKKVNEMIEASEGRLRPDKTAFPKVIIVPHGAFHFSGTVAAAGYSLLRQLQPFVRRVVLIGSSHQGNYFGISLSRAKYWEMPDRRFEIDAELTQKLLQIQGIGFDDAAHEVETSLEMQLPFIGTIFHNDVKILPILVEDASIEQVSDLIDAVWGGPETVIVIATDLSAGTNADLVRKKDENTAQLIEKKDFLSIKDNMMCSPLPVAGVLAYASENGYSVRMLDLRTSADIFPASDKVMGFGVFGVYETAKNMEENKQEIEELLREHQESLLRIAAQSIVSGFERGRSLRVREARYPEDLQKKGATFVSIYHNGILRGSAGSTEPERSILEDISENAYAAAFSDFRFIPLGENELKESEISISFLTRPVPIRFSDEKDLLAQIKPQQDGLVLRERSNKALFLPQIWETFQSPKEFLSHLKRKAGLPLDYWSPTVKVYRFQVIDINSGDLENPQSIWSPR